MKRFIFFILFILALGPSSFLQARNLSHNYQIYISASLRAAPQNKLFKEQCDWPVLRDSINGYKYLGRQIDGPLSHKRLHAATFSRFMRKSDLLVGMEFGEISPPSKGVKQEPWRLWLEKATAEMQPIFDAGWYVDTVHVDGPIRRILGFKQGKYTPGLSYEKSIEQLVKFWVNLERKYPNIRLGYLVNLPVWDYSKDYPGVVGGVTDLTGKYFQETLDRFYRDLTKAGGKISFLEIDCPYFFYSSRQTITKDANINNINKIKHIKKWCDNHNVKLHLIINERSIPKRKIKGNITEEILNKESARFTNHSIRYVQSLADNDITPDVFIIQSWFSVPRFHVPETSPGTTTYSFLRILEKIHQCFGEKYLKNKHKETFNN